MTPAYETYIVTGATGGIGRAIVSGLIDQGLDQGRRHIILACRNLDKARRMIQEFEHDRMYAMELDLESFESVRNFAGQIKAGHSRVCGLFHNAGTMPGKVHMTRDGYESATQTNFLSPMLLTELLTGSMAGDASVVFTTSITRKAVRFRSDWADRAVNHHGRFTTYGRSKKMIASYCAYLASREDGIRANCSDPGIVDSGMITMDNPLIDRLSARFFRPAIYTTSEGAAPALHADSSHVSGFIFTLHKCRPIPPSYTSSKALSILRDAMTALDIPSSRHPFT